MDDSIVTLLMKRDEAGLNLLEEKYGNMIRYIVCSINYDSCDIEECISDIYQKVWNKIDTFDSKKGEFRSWLTVISRNTAVSKLKKRSVVHCEFDESIADRETAESLVVKNEQRRVIENAVSLLSTVEQKLFYRKYYYMQSTEQIAVETGLSLRAVEGRLYRIRKKLRKVLEVYFGE